MAKRTRNSSNGSIMIRWDLLANDRVIECIDKLLNGEVISQISNSCSLSRVANIVCEIRKVIGFDGIVNIPLGIGKLQGYKLANDDEVKHRLVKLKDEIISKQRGKSL
ncbi:hypothetical protein JCM11957_10700 [Caminibacter profundus]